MIEDVVAMRARQMRYLCWSRVKAVIVRNSRAKRNLLGIEDRNTQDR